ncbi:MHO_4530 family protein [Mycoplasma crocodyli]|uniref:MHO_4530 family protein n=1 Tax=Mycoplasma crocodyli TaxID=50052 RepID=UPI0003136570|nr:hypothetical protein [Mycoplasma crocodyli]
MNYTFWLAIIAGIIIIISGTLALLIINLINSRAYNGTIHFIIDPQEKRVLRNSPKTKYLSVSLDCKRSKFNYLKYISLEDFYDFFEKNTVDKIKDVIEGNYKFKTEVDLHINPKITKKYTVFEKIINFFWFSDTRKYISTNHMHINPQDDGRFYCNIDWDFKKTKKYKVTKINTSKGIKKMTRGPYLVVSGLLKPFFIINNVNDYLIKNLLNKLNLPSRDIHYYIERGVIFFIYKKPSDKKIKKMLLIINELNKNIEFDSLVNGIALTEVKQIFDKKELDEHVNKFSFQLYNIKVDSLNSKFYYYGIYNKELDLDYSNFMILYHSFKKNNEAKKYEVIKSYIKNYSSGNSTNMKVMRVKVLSENGENWDFFYKIPYINYKYENDWNNYIIDKYGNDENIIIPISQEGFLNYVENKNRKKTPIFMIYSFNDDFYFDQLKQKIAELKKKKIPTALYIKNINKPLINLINIAQIRVLVMSKQITDKINNVSVFYDCMNILHISNSNSSFLVYELKNLNIDPHIVKKAGIAAYFEPMT